MYAINPKLIETLDLLTASEEVSTYEVSNLYHALASRRWRSTSLYPNVVGQFDASHTPDFWGSWYTNATRTDWARFRLATSQANLTNGNAIIDVYDNIWPGCTGKFFSALSFSGTGNVDFTNVLDQTTGSFSVQFRMRRTTVGSLEIAVSKKSGIGTQAGFSIWISTTDKVGVKLADGALTASKSASGVASDSVFETYTVVVDRVADEMYLYRGAILESPSVDISFLGSLSNTEALKLAKISSSSYTIDLDEFRFWSRALSASEIASGGIAAYDEEIDVISPHADLELYWRANEGGGVAALDDSGNGLDGTISNGTYLNTEPATCPDLSGWPHVHQRSIINNPTAGMWFRIDYNFMDNADGYVQVGKLLINAKDNLPEAISLSPNDSSRAMASKTLSAGGMERSAGGWKRSLQFKAHYTEDEYLGVLEPLVRGRNGIGPVGVVIHDDEATYPMSYMAYGYLDVISVGDQFHGRKVVGRVVET